MVIFLMETEKGGKNSRNVYKRAIHGFISNNQIKESKKSDFISVCSWYNEIRTLDLKLGIMGPNLSSMSFQL